MAETDSDEYHSAEEETVKKKLSQSAESLSKDSSNLSESLANTCISDSKHDGNGEDKENRVNEEVTEFVSNLDNKYISEGTDDVNSEKIELTEEQIKEMREQATKLKTSGNEAFKSDDIVKAIQLYSEAISLYPSDSSNEIAICYANRAACNIKLENHEDVVEDCTKALELRPDYLKALMRRAQSNEALENLEEALKDYNKALELDPSQSIARHAAQRLPDQIKEQQEKMKEEMIGKLKELGDAVLKPFGLSTSNFQLQQDPNTGGYSVNFKR